jgi:hypothetical protein
MESVSNLLGVVASVMGIGSPLLGALVFLHNQAKNFQKQKEVVKALTKTVIELKSETESLKRDVVTKGELNRLHIDLNARVLELKQISHDYKQVRSTARPELAVIKEPPSSPGRIIDLDERSFLDAHSLEQRVDWLTRREKELSDLVQKIKRVVVNQATTIKNMQVKTK